MDNIYIYTPYSENLTFSGYFKNNLCIHQAHVENLCFQDTLISIDARAFWPKLEQATRRRMDDSKLRKPEASKQWRSCPLLLKATMENACTLLCMVRLPWMLKILHQFR